MGDLLSCIQLLIFTASSTISYEKAVEISGHIASSMCINVTTCFNHEDTLLFSALI